MPPSSPQGFQYSPILATAQMVDARTGVITGTVWPLAFQQLSNQLLTLQAIANTAFGTNLFTVATQPTLAVSDAGYVGFLTDYAHLVYWTGTAWVFLDGGGGFFQEFATAPQGAGWQLSDGTTTHYLTVGATLTETAFTTPDRTTGVYSKGGAYTGTVNAASAPGATVSGTTAGQSNDHTHTVAILSSTPTTTMTVQSGVDATIPGIIHEHGINGTTAGTSADHTHAAGSLAVAVDATGEPKNIAVPVYFRR